MGHMYPKTLVQLMSNLSDTTLSECVKEAKERGIGVEAAEGIYYDQYMYEMAFEALLSIYDGKGMVTLLPETEEQAEAINLMRQGKELEGSHKIALYETPFLVSDDIILIDYIEF